MTMTLTQNLQQFTADVFRSFRLTLRLLKTPK